GDMIALGGVLPAGLSSTTVDNGTSIEITITGSATIAEYQSVVDAVAFSSTSSTGGVREIEIQTNDGELDSNVDLVEIEVKPNNPPTAVDDTMTTPANALTSLSLVGNDNDSDGDPITVTAIDGSAPPSSGVPSVTIASGATVVLQSDGTVYYDANGVYDTLEAGETAVDSFTYTITDGNGGTDVATTTVTITGVTADDNSAYQMTSDDLNVLSFDPENDEFENVLLGDADGDPANNDQYNALGYNPYDDKLYGFDNDGDGPPGNASIVEIDKLTGAKSLVVDLGTSLPGMNAGDIVHNEGDTTYNFADLFTSPNFTAASGVAAADIDGSLGFHYATGPGTNNVFITDIGSGTYLGVLSAGLSGNIADITFDPKNGLLWGANNNDVYSVDPISGTTTVYNDVIAGQANNAGVYGGSFADKDGNVAFLHNGSGGIYWFNTDTPLVSGTASVNYLVQGNAAGGNDGAADSTVSNDLFRPHVFLDADGSTGGSVPGAYFAFEQGGAPISIADSDASIVDFNQTTIESLTVDLTNLKAGDTLLINGAAVSGGDSGTFASSGGPINYSVTATPTSLEIAFSGTYSEADYLEALMAVQYQGSASAEISPRYIEVTVNDGSADSSVATSIIFVNQAAVPPVVLDMDGDGVEFDSVAEGIAMDVDGDGQLEQTAWADEDDAVLVYDANNNGDVDGPEEFVFASYSSDANATDMEGLAEHFDTNQDGLLSAEDAEWSQFHVWQDADGNGEVGEGEMVALEEVGIESIGLVSDGESYTAAGGDVTVHGESTVTYDDGSTGVAADAAFAYDEDFASADLEVTTGEGESLNLDEALEPVVPEGCESCVDEIGEAPVGGALDDDILAASSNGGLI
ncbi:MAG: Ig-like domain-containing protein, partial [Verrucomicrobiota bacterium]